MGTSCFTSRASRAAAAGEDAIIVQQSGKTDSELLVAYRTDRSPEAFAQLYDRYAPIVYSTALRVLNDASKAEDATQAVFIVFSNRIVGLPESTVLAGWFYMTAQHCAQRMRRAEVRRSIYERRAAGMSRPQGSSGIWKDVRPDLDDALAALPHPQRDALLMRYFQGLSLAEAARQLGCPEKTVDTRLTRGLARLRERLGQRGPVLTSVALAALLSERAVHAAPAELGMAVKAVCTGKAAASTVALSTAQGLLKTIALGKLATVVLATAMIISVAAPAVYVASITPQAGAAQGPGEPAPASVSAPAQTLLLLDFEDGAAPATLRLGKIAAGPQRGGNRFCAQAMPLPDNNCNRTEVWLGVPDARFLTLSENAQLSFDCFLDSSINQLTLYAVDLSDHGWRQLQVNVPMQRWERLTVSLSDFKDPGWKNRKTIDVEALKFDAYSIQPVRLYIDNVRVTQPSE